MHHRLLVISEDFPPYPGGIAQWAYGVSTALARKGITVFLLTRYREAYPINNEQSNLHIRFVYGKRWAQFRTVYFRRAVREFLREIPDIETVVATTWNAARGLKSIVSTERIRLITVLHGMEILRARSWWKKSLLLHTLHQSDHLIAVSTYTAQQVQKLDPLLQHKMSIFPNGVDPERFRPGLDTSPILHKYGIPNRRPILLTLARVIRRKGHDVVLRVLPLLLDKYPNLLYLICGPADPAYRRELALLVEALNLQEHVFFIDYVPVEEVPLFYNLCDVYIMISREIPEQGDVEGFGITYLEANACGKPVIAGKSGGVQDAVVDGITGLCVDPDDHRAIANAIMRVLENRQFAALLGKNGRKRVEEKLSWDKITEAMFPHLFAFARVNSAIPSSS